MAQTTIDFRERTGLSAEDAIPFELGETWAKVAEIAREHLAAQRDAANGTEVQA